MLTCSFWGASMLDWVLFNTLLTKKKSENFTKQAHTMLTGNILTHKLMFTC